MDGLPSAAIHRAHKVGHNNNNTPMGLLRRVSTMYRFNLSLMDGQLAISQLRVWWYKTKDPFCKLLPNSCTSSFNRPRYL